MNLVRRAEFVFQLVIKKLGYTKNVLRKLYCSTVGSQHDFIIMGKYKTARPLLQYTGVWKCGHERELFKL